MRQRCCNAAFTSGLGTTTASSFHFFPFYGTFSGRKETRSGLVAYSAERQVKRPISEGSAGARPRCSQLERAIPHLDLQTIRAPGFTIVAGHWDDGGTYVLVADVRWRWSSKRQSHADTRTKATAATAKTKTTNPNAHGRGRAIIDMWSADKRNGRCRKPAAIRSEEVSRG
jgi:hypothetical protein